MPKLTIDSRTRGKAVGALLRLYKAEPDFAHELEELRIIYAPVLVKWLGIAIPAWTKMKKTLTREEFSATRDYFLTENQTISGSLHKKLRRLLATPEGELGVQLGEYEKALTVLAYKWQLKAPWTGYALILNQILDWIPEDVRKAEMPLGMLEPFLPSEPLPPLRFEVHAHELMYSGRQELQDKFAKALVDYESELKRLGWRELPSSLEKHAHWWFEHYVHHKKYRELEEEESRIGRESIKRAVWELSKLLGIKSK